MVLCAALSLLTVLLELTYLLRYLNLLRNVLTYLQLRITHARRRTARASLTEARRVVQRIIRPFPRCLVIFTTDRHLAATSHRLKVMSSSRRRICTERAAVRKATFSAFWMISVLLIRVVSAAQNIDSDMKPFNLTKYYFSEEARLGPGIWKFAHYLPVYERHFARFRGTDVHFLEVGIHSGGSLRMWRRFFGEKAVIMGMDRLNATRRYESDPRYGRPNRIFVGDQSSIHFWDTFKRQVGRLDILLDDGGHKMHLQRATASAMLPYLSLGGVYLCEDLIGRDHDAQLRWYYDTLVPSLNVYKAKPLANGRVGDYSDTPTSTQRSMFSLTFYPFQVVIEKRTVPLDRIDNEAFEGEHIGSSALLFAKEQKDPVLRHQYQRGHIVSPLRSG